MKLNDSVFTCVHGQFARVLASWHSNYTVSSITGREIIMEARMVIGEALSDEQVKEFSKIYTDEVAPVMKREPGFASANLLIEDGGNMAVCLSMWQTREDCLRYHSGRAYREFVARTQHLLLGNFVVKLFTVGA